MSTMTTAEPHENTDAQRGARAMPLTCAACGADLLGNREWWVWKCPNGHDDPLGPYDEAEEIRDQTATGRHTSEPEAATTEVERLRSLMRGVVVAAGRMVDGWAEGDKAVKQGLWRNLHAAAEAAHDEVYPL